MTILGSLISLLLVASLFLKLDWKWLVLIRSAGIGLLYLFWLKETPFSFEGMFGDNHYYTLVLEKFYHSILPYSHEYKNIHFSLPPLFFFLIGRIGALLSTAAGRAEVFPPSCSSSTCRTSGGISWAASSKKTNGWPHSCFRC